MLPLTLMRKLLKHTVHCFLLSIVLTFVCTAKSHAQPLPDTAVTKKLVSTLNNYNSKFTSEKVYLHFDKPYYAVGDTIWFKAYLLNAATRKASAYSNKIYVDLINDSSTVVQSLVIPLASGLGYGDFKVDDRMQQGGYTIRAYTNWMQNFGAESFFQQRFYIGKPDNNSWLLSEQHQAINTAAGKQVKLAMQLKNARGLPVVNEGITLRLLEGRKGILKNDLQTAVDGKLNADFVIPTKTNMRRLSILLVNAKDKSKSIRMPFYADAANDIDLQFMPEGGSLIAGLYNKIGFKAIGEDGLGADVEGTIYNSKNQEVTTFKSLHSGMGNFVMVPNAGETYTAKIKLPDGSLKSYNLPAPKPSGMMLRAEALSHPDSVRIYITATTDQLNQNKTYSLVAQGKDTVYFGKALTLTNGYYNIRIAKNWFPTGIVNFMLTSPDNKPVSSRKVFIDRHDQLKVTVAPDKPVYAFNDSVTLKFKVTNGLSDPVMANFSVSVTDDGQVRNDLRTQHADSYLLLASELKGNIENPAWYFDATQATAPRALDNLMLTQGWSGFSDTKALVTPVPQPAFLPEPNNDISGRVTNFFNKPAPGRQLTLMINKKQLMVFDTISDAAGKFVFKNLPLTDTVAYTIKAHNVKGKEAAVGFDVPMFAPAPVSPPDSTLLMPWNVNTDATLLNYIKASKTRLDDKLVPSGVKGRVLNEVKIRDVRKASIPGIGGEEVYFADNDVDAKELTSKGNISLLEYMQKYIYGFHTGPYRSRGEYLFVKGNLTLNILIDQISVYRFRNPDITPGAFMTTMLDRIPAAAVTNLVIYHKYYPPAKDVVSYIVIKTRSGNGPVLKPTPGVYVYRPLPLYMPREFYRPRYIAKVSTPQPDLRSTIHWEPNVVTDADGYASISFYAAGKASTYSVVIEGTDMQGHFGVSTSKIVVAQNIADGKKQAP